jgi:hypothetical protein
VHGGTAYRADPIDFGADDVVLVECQPYTSPVDTLVVDHHRPGDPGHGRPPAQYLSASSIGQVIAALAELAARGDARLPDGWRITRGRTYTDHTRRAAGWQKKRVVETKRVDGCCRTVREFAMPLPEYVVDARADRPANAWGESPDGRRPAGYSPPSKEGEYQSLEIPQSEFGAILMIAAADHCLGAAYRGECPGVDPDELMRWRAESRAAFQGRSVEEVLADIEAAQAELRRASLIELDGPTPSITVADMRRDTPIPELPEAAMRLGVSYISGPLIGPDGRCKVTCSGRAEHVSAFLDHWAPSQGLIDTYGDPARGFAGGYLS